MRALNFLSESAAKELADKLPTLKRTDYDAIDELMQNISLKHNITGKKLHDLFVTKYGHTPDVWVKKIKQRNEDVTVNEGDVVPFKQKNPLTPNLIKQLKALSETALEIFWEGSYMPTAAQGQIAQLGKNEEQRMFKQNEAQFKALGYGYSMNEENSDLLYLHSLAREAWYEAEKPAHLYRGLPDLVYNRETNTLSYYDLIGDDGYEYTDNTQFDESKMSEIDIEYQDLQKLPDMAFQSRYKMTKQQWLEKYKNLFTEPTEFEKLYKQAGPAPMEESTGQEYVLFVNGNPASKYMELYQAETDLKHLQKQFPNQKFEIRQEVCQLQPIPRQIKEALDKLREQPEVGMMPFNEAVETDDDIKQINEFVAWAKKILHVKGNPQFTFSKDTEKAQEGHHTGVHSGNQIWVYIGNRNLIDIFRTVFHELVHQRQEELGMIKEGDSYPGSPIEVMADMLAGKYIKIYGKRHPEIFQ